MCVRHRPDDVVEVLGRGVGGGCLLVAPLSLLGPRVLDVDLGGRHVGEQLSHLVPAAWEEEVARVYHSSTGSLMIDRFINAINFVIWC